MAALFDLINLQKQRRDTLLWKNSLRDENTKPKTNSLSIPEKIPGLARISLTGNIAISDDGLTKVISALREDVYVRAIDLQGLVKITKRSGEAILSLLEANENRIGSFLTKNVNLSENFQFFYENFFINSKEKLKNAISALSIIDVRGCETYC